MVAFAGQSATAAWSGETLSINGLSNIRGDETGTVTASASELLPVGYTVTSYSFNNPDGTNAVNISGTLSIAEGAEASQSVIADNKVSYVVNIVFTEALGLGLTVQDFNITVMDTLGANIAVAAESLNIDLFARSVTITTAAGISNFNGNAISLNDGSLSLAAAAGMNIAFEPGSINFSDPAGTAAATNNQGIFITTSDSDSASYTLSVEFAPTYNLELDGTTIAARQSDVVVRYNVPPCTKDLPTVRVFTIDANGSEYSVAGATLSSAGTVHYYDSAMPANNTHRVTAARADGSSLGGADDFAITATVQECTAFAGGSGTSDAPWIIDNDMRLDLLSRLVNGDQHSTYGNDHYKLSAELNMGITEAPWAEDSTHGNSNINGFTPVGKTRDVASSSTNDQNNRFSGTLNCAGYSISNLYISNINSSASAGYGGYYNGLFGVISNGAVSNCTLENANIRGISYAGGIAGYVDSPTGSSVALSSNTISGGSITADSNYAGGIAGYVNGSGSSSVTLSSNAISGGSITARSNVGGIAGAVVNFTSSAVLSSNTISGGSITGNRAGGIAGFVDSDSSSSTFSSNAISGVSITENYSAGGGIAGYVSNTNSSSSTFSRNAISGVSITARGIGSAGGIAGLVDSDSSSSSTFSRNAISGGSITAVYAGGVAGYVSGSSSIGNSVFIGIITGTRIGGVLASDNGGTYISNSYAAARGTVTGTPITNYGLASGVSTNSYYDNTLNTGATAANGQSASSLQTPTTNTGIYSHWDVDVWNFGTSSQYPVLKGLPLTPAEQCAGINAVLGTSTDCTY